MREAFDHLWDTKTFLISTAAMAAAKWFVTLTFGVALWVAFAVALAVKGAIWFREFRSFKRKQKDQTLAPRKKGPFIPTAIHAALGVTITAYFAAFLALLVIHPTGHDISRPIETAFFLAAGTAIAAAVVWLAMASWTIRIRGLLIREFIANQIRRDADYIEKEWWD